MSKSVRPIPDGYAGLMAYIVMPAAIQAIEFYKRAFGAVERLRLPGAGPNSIGHAELEIGPSVLMLADECPEATSKSPRTLGGTTFCFVLYVPDVDVSFKQALDAGAKVLRPLENKFYGDRTGVLTEPFCFQCTLMTHIEDLPPEQISKRAAAEMANMAKDKKS